jgi:hypothetical protein
VTAKGHRHIDALLDEHHLFLAYVKANALLHDADKITGEFIKWSLQGGKEAVGEYDGHNLFFDGRKKFLEHKNTLLPFSDSDNLDVPFPCRKVALEPKALCREICADILKEHVNDDCFIKRLQASGNEILVKLAGMLSRKNGRLPKNFFSQDFTVILSHSDFVDIQDEFKQIRAPWLQKAKPGRSLFDFYLWHHSPNIELKSTAPTVLLLFTAGTAGVDGIDTGYETESEKIKVGAWHHEPRTIETDTFLISTPFGFERDSGISAAEEACTVKENINSLATVLKQKAEPLAVLHELERKVEADFSHSIIRTGRPLNDVTLADHSISVASLAAVHGARVVLESASAAAEGHYYCLPVRAKKGPENSDWPVVRFAIFSCAVNTGHLDSMAMDLKDITAIRKEVDRLLNNVVELFTCRYPVGGFAYRDQHGAHLVVPVLGDPGKRWIQADSDEHLQPAGTAKPEISWLVDVPGDSLTNELFREWLFETARDAILEVPLCFDQELLVGLRHAVIGDRLNQLAAAIKWTRTIDHLGVGPAKTDQNDAKIRIFQYRHPNWQEEKSRLADLCSVCGLRLGVREGKCLLCLKRRGSSNSSRGELADIKKMAAQADDNRLALLSVAFNLDSWLSEEDNSGIFLYAKDDSKAKKARKFEKDKKQQRLNSFGRLRRIWRVSERFLQERCDQIRLNCRIHADADLSYMRTILLQPQDLQVILPADRCGAVLDDLIEKFQQEFGRVAGRIPFHVSVLVFPFRVPIYLVLEGARRLRQAALSTAFSPAQVVRQVVREDNSQIISRTENVNGRRFCFSMPVHWWQNFQPPDSLMKNKDQFHANLCTKLDGDGRPDEWIFTGTLPADTETDVYMVNNRLSLAEIGSGLILNELEQSSASLPPSRCHDIPLEYWPVIRRLSELEAGISSSKCRTLRSEVARREILWDRGDPLVGEVEREACEICWRDPQRLGAKRWSALSKEEQELLVDSSLNGGIFIESMVKKRLKI